MALFKFALLMALGLGLFWASSGQDCSDLGWQMAQGVAVAACEATKRDCGVGPGQAAQIVAPRGKLKLTDCCKVVIGSCQGSAANISCTSGSYGKCQDWEFKNKFQNIVAIVCRTGICGDSACKDALQGDAGC